MCGITGCIALKPSGIKYIKFTKQAVQALQQRGPDYQDFYVQDRIALGHARLSVIDTSVAANQPLWDAEKRYVLVFNGEIYNYKTIKQTLQQYGHTFTTASDSEVLLHAYMHWGAAALQHLNGFFACAIYDTHTQSLFVARDRMGIKPLLVYQSDDVLIFASEMKALLAYQIPKKIDYNSLYAYFQLNYIPPPYSIFEQVHKLEAGNYLYVKYNLATSNFVVRQQRYYHLPKTRLESSLIIDYKQAQKSLYNLLDNAVQQRLIADVPLGAFLSGGIDSSVIVALASAYMPKLNTFSIGYVDEPFFDETNYAKMVAKRYNTNHTVFALKNTHLLQALEQSLSYLDEPFADSSALAVNLLSQYVRKQVTVALSGDGSDELFAGYNKHAAEFKVRKGGLVVALVKQLLPIWRRLPQSRQNRWGNLARQLQRFAEGARCLPNERYWRWASLLNEEGTKKLLQPIEKWREKNVFEQRKSHLLRDITPNGSFNEVLYADMNMVLQGDMLTKVDSMSMAHSLEVRTPFLDHHVVDFAFSLPVSYKITRNMKKRIVQDTFKNMLPAALYNRPKHGFEVPLLKWLKNDLQGLFIEPLLNAKRLKEQGIFNPKFVQVLLKKLHSNTPADSPATVWALLVFQYWWQQYME